jgi:hypothetical protein
MEKSIPVLTSSANSGGFAGFIWVCIGMFVWASRSECYQFIFEIGCNKQNME